MSPGSSSRPGTCTRAPATGGAWRACSSSAACARPSEGRAVAEVKLTVNGTDVALEVEPRLTLVDALRHRLGLTGTHVGCEHGVCGACTVLLDGAAVRSCLMFCVQAQGHEVTTVEALGEVDDLHPLQAAFRRHHGLQCGFCTPGFLMSAYELLREGADGGLGDDRLREELSGVLCRCTGYAGIVEAVQEVAREYPDGLPAPKALGRPITVRRSVPPPGEEQALAAASAAAAARGQAAGAQTHVQVAVPEGEPNETVAVTTAISPSPVQTWELMADFMRLTRCMPGVELDTDHGEDTYSGRVGVHLGPMRLSFQGAARVLERDGERRRLRAVASGRDASGSGVQADVTVSADPGGGGTGTALRAEAKLYLSGRAAQFGRSLAGDVSRGLFTEFGACVERTLTTGEAVTPRRLSGAAVAWRLVRARAGALWRRVRGLEGDAP
ncbi:MAG: 2Fe-2S iron-sulfur cluster binding domain-containing protein [Solirubrobacterales bacterium]|nr:2Fe-2S iron-sulfur cluster binding domain-containing protein [Solirubrobacterales bacterium]